MPRLPNEMICPADAHRPGIGGAHWSRAHAAALIRRLITQVKRNRQPEHMQCCLYHIQAVGKPERRLDGILSQEHKPPPKSRQPFLIIMLNKTWGESQCFLCVVYLINDTCRAEIGVSMGKCRGVRGAERTRWRKLTGSLSKGWHY